MDSFMDAHFRRPPVGGRYVEGRCRSGSNGMPHHPNILELLGDASHSRRFIRWRDVVRYALQSIGNAGSFLEITEEIEKLVPAVWLHRYWEARVLRIVRKDSEIEKIGRDRWRLRSSAPHRDSSSN